MGAFKTALTGRLLSAIAVCFAIAIAMFMCGGVGSVAAEEVVIEVPTVLATETNETATGVYYLTLTSIKVGLWENVDVFNAGRCSAQH